MLLVATQIGPSKIHGMGVFAVSPIRAGTPVWKFSPGLDLELDPAAIHRMPELVRTYFAHYGYVDRYRKRLILCFDHARFVNHSDDPNVEPDYASDPHGTDIAIRDIAAGEEIVMDYGSFEEAVRPM